jgi:hypothetical protein
LPAPPWPIITILRISPVFATFGSPTKGYNGLSTIKTLRQTSIRKKPAQNKPSLRKKSARPIPSKTGRLSPSNILVSNGKFFRYCKYFLHL